MANATAILSLVFMRDSRYLGFASVMRDSAETCVSYLMVWPDQIGRVAQNDHLRNRYDAQAGRGFSRWYLLRQVSGPH